MQLQRLLYPHDPCLTRLPAEAVTARSRYGKTAVAVMEGNRLQEYIERLHDAAQD
jgi:hypothetical protein